MNYLKIYDFIIHRAKNRSFTKQIYTEKHHIQPKCLNGSNDINNIAKLTPKEHYICHHLLCKIYKNNKKIDFAFCMMCWCKNKNTQYRTYFVPARIYEQARRKISLLMHELHKGKKLSEEHKRKIGNGSRGHILSKEGREKVAASKRGKKRESFSGEWKLNLSLSKIGKQHSKKSKQKMRESALKRIRTPEEKQKMSALRTAQNKARTGENHPLYGKHRSEETKRKIGNANRGRKVSQETRNKISKKGKGRIVREETRRKMSENCKKFWKKGGHSEETLKGIGQKNSKRLSKTIWVNKDGKTIQIKKEDIENYISNGWNKGRNQQRKWINKEDQQKYVLEKDLREYLKIGWTIGMLKWSIERRLKSSQNRTGRIYVEDINGKRFFIKSNDPRITDGIFKKVKRKIIPL